MKKYFFIATILLALVFAFCYSNEQHKIRNKANTLLSMKTVRKDSLMFVQMYLHSGESVKREYARVWRKHIAEQNRKKTKEMKAVEEWQK